jgi:hypothetical protein
MEQFYIIMSTIGTFWAMDFIYSGDFSHSCFGKGKDQLNVSPLHEGEGQGEGEELDYAAQLPLIRPSATFSLMEKGIAAD